MQKYRKIKNNFRIWLKRRRARGVVMGKNTAVIFTKNNVKFMKGLTEDQIAHLSKFDQVVINPALRGVSGFPPHHWKLVNGEIKPMNAKEREERDLDHLKNGVDNDIRKLPLKAEIKIKKKAKFNWMGIGIGVGAGAGALVSYLIQTFFGG